MNTPIIIETDTFQEAWATAVLRLKECKWEAWNVVVNIKNPLIFDKPINDDMTNFANLYCNELTPKKVAFTIFPYCYYYKGISREALYRGYNLFYRRSRKMERRGWGTYFNRMINYVTEDEVIDQLGKVIDHINGRKNTHGSSHVILIPKPNKDFDRTMGAPCLNYITIQVEKIDNVKHINLLAVYRNHDFLNRAYGNYFGLCELLKYIASETNSQLGVLTCVSSHAYIDNTKTELSNIANRILED